MEKKRIYLNDAQYYLLSIAARVLVAVCGRGIGKGLIQASRTLQFVQAMPMYRKRFGSIKHFGNFHTSKTTVSTTLHRKNIYIFR